MKRMMGLVAALTIAGSAGALAQNVNPVGIWDWEIDFQGQAMAGYFEITGDDGAWGGTATADAMGTTDLLSVEVDGNLITLTVDTGGQGEVIIEMTVDGNDFTGVGSLGADQFAIVGSRRAG